LTLWQLCKASISPTVHFTVATQRIEGLVNHVGLAYLEPMSF